MLDNQKEVYGNKEWIISVLLKKTAGVHFELIISQDRQISEQAGTNEF